MATARRFVFVETLKAGQQRLMLCNLDTLRPLRERTARIITQMGIVPGDLPTDGSVPETYLEISVRPDNAFVAASSAQVGNDFVDYNIAVYSMETGALSVRFNEHSVADVNRANCPCPLFDAFLASEAALGVPQSQIDSYDYQVISEGTGIGAPSLTWSAAGTLIVVYGFDVVVVGSGFGVLGQGFFAFEVAVTPAPGGSLQILSRNAVVASYSPMPRNSFSLRPKPRTLPPTGPNVIHYGKQPVKFYPWFWRKLPQWIGFPSPLLAYRVADRVEGFVA